MFARIRETWRTLRAIWRFCADFFRRWFLPLHSDDEDDEEENGERMLGWRWDDDDEDETGPEPEQGTAERRARSTERDDA